MVGFKSRGISGHIFGECIKVILGARSLENKIIKKLIKKKKTTNLTC